MKLQEYNDTHATFQWWSKPGSTPYVIPENVIFPLNSSGRGHSTFPHGSGLELTLKTQNDEAKCRWEDDNSDRVSISTISDKLVQVTLNTDMRMLPTINPGCRLRVVKTSRTISLSSDPILQKQMRHGMNNEAMGKTYYYTAGYRKSIESPITKYRYIETLADIPTLRLQKYNFFGYAVFRKSLKPSYIVPSGWPLIVHVAQDFTRRDSVRLTFSSAEGCGIELYYTTPDGEPKLLQSTTKGFYFERREEEVVKIVVNRRLLNKEFSTGTQFHFAASCRLLIRKVSRKLTIDLPRDRRTGKTTIGLEVEASHSTVGD